MIGGFLAGLGWVLSGMAGTLTALYLGSTLKWFSDHRGLASGLTAAGFGAGQHSPWHPLPT